MMPTTARRLIPLRPNRALPLLLLLSPPFVSSFHAHRWDGAKTAWRRKSATSPPHFSSFMGRRRSAVQVWSSSSPTSSATTSSNNEASVVTPSPLDVIRELYGGDTAGHSATFSSTDGTLIRVPEHLVPESLIEWGQVPSCLEVLTSEDVTVDDADRSSDAIRLERKVVAVVPEVGCGVDNLDTMRSSETFHLSVGPKSDSGDEGGDGEEEVGVVSAYKTGDVSVVALDAPLSPLRGVARRRVETTFELPDEISPDDDGNELTYPRRVRVSFDVLPTQHELTNPITVVVDRQTSAVSSGGTIGEGGGLDGRTVMKLIGREASNRPFADGKGVSVEDLGGTGDDLCTLSLPGNVAIAYGLVPSSEGAERWQVDVSLVAVASDGAVVGRTVVRRFYGADEGRGAEDVTCWFDKKA